jgi:hypothetical protein
MKRNPPWRREELILALDLYVREGQLSADDPRVLRLSEMLRSLAFGAAQPDAERFRNSNGVAMKLANFASIDPGHHGAGLSRGGQADRHVWNEFAQDREGLAREAAILRLLAQDSVLLSPEVDAAKQVVAEQAGRGPARQGLRIHPQTRKAIEVHSMSLATAHFSSEGWMVSDCSAREPYDLLLERGAEIVHVEVKGTSSSGGIVLLTPGEVLHAKEFYPAVALFIVSNIQVSASDPSRVSGGRVALVYPWDIATGELRPIGYEYHLGV